MTARDAAFEAWRDRAAAADILDLALSAKVGARLKKKSREYSGPCPRCGGKDRFNVNPAKQIFNCRNAAGGNAISMVMHVCAVPFLAACEIITGEAPPAAGTQLTDAARAEAARLRDESAARAKRRDADENLYRERERRTVFDVFKHAHPLAGSSAAEYYALRGLVAPPTIDGRWSIRCVEAMPYFVGGGEDMRVVHRGPAKVLPIVDNARKFRGLHLTYLDLANPKGKLVLEHEGEVLDAKKTRGSKHGNHVELLGDPIAPRQLVLGEGDEKTIGFYRGLAYSGERDLSSTAFWSACDLGNLAGGASDSLTHPSLKHAKTGRAQKVAGVVPDFSARAIGIPESVVDLVLLGDSTSDRFTTQCAMARACARYARPGLNVRVAWAPDGIDFDDPWRTVAGDAERQAWAEQICAIVDAAEPFALPAQVPETRDVLANIDQLIIKGEAPAPARASAPQGAAPVEPHETGAGDAGAPLGLPSASETAPGDAPDAPDPVDAALGPPAPPPAPPDCENIDETSRQGRPGARSANRAKWTGPPRKYGEGRDALNKWLAFFPLTELGLVERYVQREKGRLCYCPALGWLAWNGIKWAREGAEGKAVAAGHDTVRAVQDEAASISGTEHDVLLGVKTVGKGDDKEEVEVYLSDQLEAFGRASETKARMTLHEHAKPYISHEVEEFDSDHLAVNILNGTLVISREKWRAPAPAGWTPINEYVRLKPHDPLDLITKLAPMIYRAGATCPLYDRSMELWQPAPSYRTFLDDWDGYSLTGDAAEQKLVLNIGTGKNGKSTWTSVKRELLGDYCESVPITTLMDAGKARSAGQATPDLAMLRTIRGLLTSEPPKGWKLDEGLVKDMTGGDKFNVRELHQKYFKLDPRFKLTIAGNHKPNISAGDRNSGIWRRVILVDWKVVIPQEQRDLRIADKLRLESSGILNRWLVGLTRWLDRGLLIPDEIAVATEEFREDRDLLGRFLAECTEQRDDGRAGVTEAHELFIAWARANGEVGRHEWTQKGFGEALKERGFHSRKISSMHWIGFSLVKSVNDFVDNDGKALSASAIDAARDGTARDARVPEPVEEGF